MRLFRPEALRGQDTLHGDVSLVPPVSWQLLGGFLLLSVVVAGVFLSLAQYARVTVLRGAVATDKGVVRLAAQHAGTFDKVLVSEGQAVKAGALLAHVAIATSEQGGSLQAARAQALALQQASLTERQGGLRLESEERIRSLTTQVEGDERQVKGFEDQIAIQLPLIKDAENDLKDVQPLQQQGLLSNRDLRLREEQVAQRRQALLKLQQEVTTRKTAIEVARSEMARIRADLTQQESQLAASRAELQRTAVGDEMITGFDLRAPVSGVVTAVLAHPGDAAGPGATAMTLVPSGSRTEAVFTAPASAAGLLAPGQKVRVAVDAYPFQTFGALDARVVDVARAAGPAQPAPGAPPEGFLVRTTLPTEILAYGAPQPLKPGMTLAARIRTRPRTLIGWMFDPVLAVARR